MGLDIWFVEDVRNAILAANNAGSKTAAACPLADPVTLQAYLEGYRAALTTIALAFGLSPSIVEQYAMRLVEGPVDIPAVAEEAEEQDAVHVVPNRIWKPSTGAIS